MLKQRVVTALVLGIIVVWGILALPVVWFGAALLFIITLGAWEWGGLIGLVSSIARLSYCILVVVLTVLIWFFLDHKIFVDTLMGFAFAYWCCVLVWLHRYAVKPQKQDPSLVWILAGLMVLVMPWVALMELRRTPELGSDYVLFLMILVWSADSSAYFSGRRWGHHKLALQISPGKTREGAYGALIATLAIALGGCLLFGFEVSQWSGFILISVVTVAFSIVGDLLESMIKRQHSVKDSGSLLPGHGGLLDRIDSLTAAAPVFLLGLRGFL